MSRNASGARPVVAVPVQRRSRDVVARILEATEELLNAEPLSDITMARVAGRAGVSVGSIYRYYADKGDLLRAAQDAALGAFERRLDARMAAAGPTVEAAVAAMVDVMRDHLESRAREIGAFMSVTADDVMAGRARATHSVKLTAFTAGLGRDRDRVLHADLDLAAEVSLSIIDGLFLGYARQITRRTPRLRLELMAREASRAALAYLLYPPPPR
jgi:AcrR family transcriptional regulator